VTDLREEDLYVRHPRRRGCIAIIGVGAVGSLLAGELAHLGYSPLLLIDYDTLEGHNIVRHRLGAEYVGCSKAESLAEVLHRDLPTCVAQPLHADFTKLTPTQQLHYLRDADLVIGAADELPCQRAVNRACLSAEIPAVYPGVWGEGNVEAAEVGEIQWVLPGRNTPCYECATIWRGDRGGGLAQPRHGDRTSLQVIVNATVGVVSALLEPESIPGLLDPERTLVLTHGIQPPSDTVRSFFRGRGAGNARIELPVTPCPACGGQRPLPATSGAEPSSPSSGLAALREASLIVQRHEHERAVEAARRESIQRAEAQRRDSHWESARRQFQSISSTLIEAIGSAAANSIISSRDALSDVSWEISLDRAVLRMANPRRIPAGTSRATARMGWYQGTVVWGVDSGAPFDVIARCYLAVGSHNGQHWIGRSHALWYCDAQDQDRYAWYETAFTETSRIHVDRGYLYHKGRPETNGIFAPLALFPESGGVGAALEGEHGEWEVAWPFTLLRVDQLDDFIDRWAGWFAAAAQGRFQLPVSMPERDPAGSWRTDGF
jgi:ThiF family